MNVVIFTVISLTFLFAPLAGVCAPLQVIGQIEGISGEIRATNDRLIVMSHDAQVDILNLPFPHAPSLWTTIERPGENVLLNDTLMFTTSNTFDQRSQAYGQSLEIYELRHLNLVGGHWDQMGNRIGAMALVESKIYTSQEGLSLYDFSDLDTVRRKTIRNDDWSFPRQVLSNGRCLLTSKQLDRQPDKIFIYGLNDPENPVKIAELTTGERPVMKIAANILYITANNSLIIYDLSNPSDPMRLKAFQLDFSPLYINVSGTAVILGGRDMVYIVELDAEYEILQESRTSERHFYTTFGMVGPYLYAHYSPTNTLYVYNCSEALGVRNTEPIMPEIPDISVWPNPFNVTLSANISIPANAMTQINFLNVNGHLLQRWEFKPTFSREVRRITIPGNDLPSGSFYLQAIGAGHSTSVPIVHLK